MAGRGKGLAIGKKTSIIEKPINGDDDDNVIDQSASGAANRINGGDGNDNIVGSALADRVNAGDGDDTVMGGAGDDVLYGNDGYDTAAYEGSIFDYIWAEGKGNTLTVTDTTTTGDGETDEGTDTLKHFEALQFDDYTLDLTGPNAALILADDQTTDEDNATSFEIEAWDFDGGTPFVSSYSVSGGGSVIATDGAALSAGMGNGRSINIDYNPNGAFESLAVGETTDVIITIEVDDGQGNLSSKDITMTITGVNDDPTLGAGAMAATEDGAVEVLDLSALGDDIDSDDDGSTLTYTVTGNPAEGSASIAGTALAFDPGANFQDLAVGETRDVVIEVTAADQHGASAVNIVTVTVTGTNDAPTLAAATAGAIEDGASVDVDLAALGDDIDSDDDGSTLTYSVSGNPSEGSASISGTTLTFDPGSDFQDLAVGETRDVAIQVMAEDAHGATAINNVTVTVTGTNDGPTLAAAVAAADEDGPSVDVDLSALGDDIDSDDDGSTLTYSVSGNPTEGTASINGTTLTFAPGSDFQDLAVGETRDVTIQVTAEDSHGATAINNVTATVTGTNDGPTFAAAVTAAVEDGPSVDVDLAALGDDVDSDDNGSTLTYSVTGSPAEGSASISGTTLTFDPGSDFQDLAVGETRDVTIQVTAEDAHGATAVNNVTVTVTGSNDAPTLAAAATAAVEDGPSVDVDLSALGDDIDNDDDGSTLTYIVSGNPTEGTASINGTILTFDPGSDFQDLAVGETRDVTIQVTAEDAHGAIAINNVTVTVTGTNDAPIIQNHTSLGFDEASATDGLWRVVDGYGGFNWSTNGGVNGEPSSNQGDILATAIGGAPSGPNAAWNGHASKISTITKSDGGAFALDSASFANLTTNYWGGPVTTVTLNGYLNGVLVGTETVTLGAVGDFSSFNSSLPVIDTLQMIPTGPVSGWNGSNSGWFAFDDFATTNAVVEDDKLTTSGSLTANDVDGDNLSWSIQGGGAGSYGTLSIDGYGNWTYTLDNAATNVQALSAGQSVTEAFTIVVDDGNGGTDSTIVNVVVGGTNDGPAANNDHSTGELVEEGFDVAGYAQATGNVLGNDTDPDTNDVLTVTSATGTGGSSAVTAGGIVILGTYGSLTIAADGSWTYDLDNTDADTEALNDGDIVQEVFTYTISDGNGGSSGATLALSIEGSADNEPPVVTGPIDAGNAWETDPDQVIDLLANASDPNGDALSVENVVVSSSNGAREVSFTMNGGEISIDPSQFSDLLIGEFEDLTITYDISDGNGGVVSTSATLTIDGYSVPPVAVDSAIMVSTVNEDGPVSHYLLGYDPEGQAIEFTLAPGSGPANGTVMINLDGTYTYTPNEGFLGTDSFSFTVTDSDGETDTATVGITVETDRSTSLNGTSGNDILIGGSYNNSINGYDGDDLMRGGAGHDWMYGGNGDDQIFTEENGGWARGEAGNDTLVGSDGVWETLLGDAGSDNIDVKDYGYGYGGANDDVLNADYYGYVYGDGGNDTLYAGVYSRAYGGTGNDELNATDDRAYLFGQGDDDILNANGHAYVHMNGGAGNDELNGGTGYSYYYGESGDDLINFGDDGGYANAGSGDDTVLGGAGNDRVYTNTGSDSVETGAGNDQVYIDYVDGTDWADGGTGSDNVYVWADTTGSTLELTSDGVIADGATVAVNFEYSQIYGRQGDDHLIGDSRYEYLYGYGGDDTIDLGDRGWAYSDSGNDTIRGGAYNEYLNGGQGDDHLSGFGGNDQLIAGMGEDTLLGGDGNDYLHLNTVSIGDWVDGGSGTDYAYLYGDTGDNNIRLVGTDLYFGTTQIGQNLEWVYTYGRNGNDHLGGGNLRDWLHGENGNDTLTGGGGNDILYGGSGNDSISGDDDNDQLIANSGEDTLEGGAGNDYLNVNTVSAGDWLDGGAGHDYAYLYGDNAGNNISLVGTDLFYNGVQIGQNIEWVHTQGRDGNDVLGGGNFQDWLYGENGHDTISGGGGYDRLYGQNGNDSIMGDAGNDYLYGGANNDILFGGSDNDYLYGQTGDDTMYGGTGNDYLDSGSGLDFADGGDGNDTVYSSSWNAGDVMYGGAGHDLLDFRSNGVQTSLIFGAFGSLTVNGVASGGGFERLNAYGSNWDDVFVAGSGSDYVAAYGGNDSVYIGDGGGRVYGGDGNDTITGGDGYEYLHGDNGEDVLDVGNGGGYAYGGADNDILIGGSGYEYLYGHGGNDIINTGSGGGAAYGGNGDDQIIGGAGHEWLYGHDGNDTISTGADGGRGYGGNHDDVITGGSGYDYLFGENGNDILDTSTGGGYADGGAGTDTVLGGSGNDYLAGGADADTISGGAGNDQVRGQQGNDLMTGGAGADQFQFYSFESTSGESDVITDFSVSDGDGVYLWGLSISTINTVDYDGDLAADDTLVTLSNGAEIGILDLVGLTSSDILW